MGKLSQALSRFVIAQNNTTEAFRDFYISNNKINKEKLSADYVDIKIQLDASYASGANVDEVAKSQFDINASNGWGNTDEFPFKTLSAAMNFVGPKVNHVAYHLRANDQTRDSYSTHLPGSMPHFSNRSMHIYNDIPKMVYVMFDLDPAKVEAAADGTFASAYINKLYTGIYGGVYFHFEGCYGEGKELVFCLSKPEFDNDDNHYDLTAFTGNFTSNIYYGDDASDNYKNGLKNMYWQWHGGQAVFSHFWTVFRNEQLTASKDNYKEYDFTAENAQSGRAWITK